MRALIVSIVLCFVLLGCTVNQSNFQYPSFAAKSTIVYPEIGKISVVSLGDELITSAQGYFLPVLIVDNDFKISITHRVHKGIYKFTHEDSNYRYYSPSYIGQLAELNGFGEDLPTIGRLRISKSNGLSVIANSVFSLPSKEVFNTSGTSWKLDDHYYFEDEDSFQQTLIYTGKSDSIIKFSYREFTSNKIREAFTTEVTYDLLESTVIAYKSFKAEIIKATNSSIEYRIISGF